MSSKEFQDRVLDGVDAAAGNIKCNTYLSCESRQNPRAADGRGTLLGDHGTKSRFKHKTETLDLKLRGHSGETQIVSRFTRRGSHVPANEPDSSSRVTPHHFLRCSTRRLP